MSVALAPAFERPRPEARRRHLHLVPALPEQSERRGSDGALRLTVRGRRLVLAVVVAAALTGAFAVAAFASGPRAPESVTVRSGQTLSDIARQQLPELPVGTAVAHLQLANQLNSSQVSTGQRLVVPEP